MPRLVTDAQREQVLALYCPESNSMASVAREVGIARQTVRAILLNAGVPINPNQKGLRGPTKAERDKAVSLYQANLSLKAIQAQTGVGAHTLYSTLRSRGLPRRMSIAARTGKALPVGSVCQGRDGYMMEKVAKDWPYLSAMPGNGDGSWIRQHRKVMAEHLRRPLLRQEQVHHINGDRSDNRIENLELRYGAHGSGVRLVCGSCGSTDLVAKALS